MRIVVSGFEPFGGRKENRSQTLVKRLVVASPVTIEPVVLPVNFAELPKALAEITKKPVDRWLMLGESSKAQGLRIERRAVNSIEATQPDNAGQKPTGLQVIPGGPYELVSDMALADHAKLARSLGLDARVSRDAGRFICNAAMYAAIQAVGGDRLVFIHVPVDQEHGSDAALARALGEIAGRMARAKVKPYPAAAPTTAAASV